MPDSPRRNKKRTFLHLASCGSFRRMTIPIPTSDSGPRADGQACPKTRQCTADYRWTAPKVIAFLDALARSGRVSEAARAVGMSRQAAYKLRARLGEPKFRDAFEGARRTGIRARAAASMARSRWDGPGLAHLARMHADSLQDDTSASQGDTSTGQGDGSAPQGDAFLHKATFFAAKRQNFSLDRVTPGPCLDPEPGLGPRSRCAEMEQLAAPPSAGGPPRAKQAHRGARCSAMRAMPGDEQINPD